MGVRALLCQVPITAISAGAAVGVRPGRGGSLWFLNELWMVKQCHSQNSWRAAGSGTMESPLSGSFARPLTLVDKFDVLLVRRGEDLLLLLACGESRSWVVVLLAVEAVENDLGRGEADG